MANARITSGSGDGAVKIYTRGPGNIITVRGLKLEGLEVEVYLEAAGGATDEGATVGTSRWEKEIPVAAPGLYSLVVKTNGPRGKGIRQQIQVQ